VLASVSVAVAWVIMWEVSESKILKMLLNYCDSNVSHWWVWVGEPHLSSCDISIVLNINNENGKIHLTCFVPVFVQSYIQRYVTVDVQKPSVIKKKSSYDEKRTVRMHVTYTSPCMPAMYLCFYRFLLEIYYSQC
jgi:hypothetical protein